MWVIKDVRVSRGEDRSAGVRESVAEPAAIPDRSRRNARKTVKRATGRRAFMEHQLLGIGRQGYLPACSSPCRGSFGSVFRLKQYQRKLPYANVSDGFFLSWTWSILFVE